MELFDWIDEERSNSFLKQGIPFWKSPRLAKNTCLTGNQTPVNSRFANGFENIVLDIEPNSNRRQCQVRISMIYYNCEQVGKQKVVLETRNEISLWKKDGPVNAKYSDESRL